MNKNKFKNLCKDYIIDNTPDISSRIDLNNINIIENKEKAIVKKPIKLKFSLPLIFKFSLAILLVISASLLIYTLVKPSTTNLEVGFETSEQVYTFSTLSAAKMLDINMDLYELNLSGKGSGNGNNNDDNILIDAGLDDLNSHINVLEDFMGDKSTINYENLISDRLEYSYKIVFSANDMINAEKLYTIYYNIINEEVLELSGIAILNDIEYPFNGKQENILEEQKITFTIYSSPLDIDNYVTVTYKVENEEQKFAYKVYVASELYTSSEISLHTENNKLITKLKIQNSEGSTYDYTIKSETVNEKSCIKISYSINNGADNEIGNIEIEAEYDEVYGNYRYKYTVRTNGHNSYEYNKERNGQ
ncbi:MAG: hypothetical protein WC942_02560 [Clostridia bacterium]|jgi:hypothetical protein